VRDTPVLICDDIIDTGGTMAKVVAKVAAMKPLFIKTYSLLRKPVVLERHNEERGRRGEAPLVADYVGFDVPDVFVVGAGMDYYGFGRKHGCIYEFEVWKKRFHEEFRRAELVREQIERKQRKPLVSGSF
jgi:hypoxanthine phosphoribosyltransferase